MGRTVTVSWTLTHLFVWGLDGGGTRTQQQRVSGWSLFSPKTDTSEKSSGSVERVQGQEPRPSVQPGPQSIE